MTDWLLRFRPLVKPRARVLFLPPAGGSAGSFRALSQLLPQDVEGVALSLPGRLGRFREAAHTRMQELIAAALPALTESLTDAPLTLFGHSLGALIGFELAHVWPAGLTRVVVAGRRAPHLPATQPFITGLRENEFIAAVNQRYGGIPAVVLADKELLTLTLPTLRADMSVYETYACAERPPLAVPITAFGGIDDKTVGEADLREWSRHTRATFTLTMCPGGHFFLSPPPPAIAELLRSL